MLEKYRFWIAILILELLWLKFAVDRPYQIGDLMFILAVIIVTSIVGMVYMLLFANHNK